MSNEKINLGKKGEEFVQNFLQNQGFSIQEKNFKSKFGEIDLIAQKGNTLAFIEVKLRNNPKFHLSQLISVSKQKKIIKTAFQYLIDKNFSQMIYRFDVALLKIQYSEKIEIEYIPNAFTSKLD